MLALVFSIVSIVSMVSPAQEVEIIRELHVYAKRQTSDSS